MRPVIVIKYGMVQNITPKDSVIIIDYDNLWHHCCPFCSGELDGKEDSIYCPSCEIDWHDTIEAELLIQRRELAKCSPILNM